MKFDFAQIEVVEFGVGRDIGTKEVFNMIAIDPSVQQALSHMASDTWAALSQVSTTPTRYEPSESYAAPTHLSVSLDDELAHQFKLLHTTHSLTTDDRAIKLPDQIFCYFAKMTDKQGCRLTGLRRASHFKGILNRPLIRWRPTDTMELIDDQVFRLDHDFDVLIDDERVHILRPAGFEYIGRLNQAILASVPQNISILSRSIPFVDFTSIQEYSEQRPRAARLLASIQSHHLNENIDPGNLIGLCKQTHVNISVENGVIKLDNEDVLDFLEVLDRRRYQVELVREEPEQYRASGRRAIRPSTAS